MRAGVRLTEVICFPRSGHHWLVDMLAIYLGNRLHYCEMYKQPELRIDICPRTNVQKNHDFDLGTPIRSDRRYIVQIRDPLEALRSRWELHLRYKHLECKEDVWRNCMREWLIYYAGFAGKWIYGDIPNCLVVRYKDMVKSPAAILSTVLRFIDTKALSPARVAYAISKQPPRDWNKPLTYKWK